MVVKNRKMIKSTTVTLYPEGTEYLTPCVLYKIKDSPNYYYRFRIKPNRENKTKGRSVKRTTNSSSLKVATKVATSDYLKFESISREGNKIVPQTVEQLVDNFLEIQEERFKMGRLKNIHSVDNKRWTLKVMLKFLNQNQQKKRLMMEVEGKEFRDYFNWRNRNKGRVKDLSVNTLSSESSKIQEFFNWCYEEDLIHDRQKPKFERLKNKSGITRGFTIEEYKILVNYLNKKFIHKGMETRNRLAREQMRDLIYVASNSGIRLSELYRIENRDLSFQKVKNSKYPICNIEVDSDVALKTNKSRINPCIRGDIVKRVQKRTMTILKRDEMRGSDPLFVTVDGYPFSVKSVRLLWSIIKNETGIERKLTHLRHFAITQRLKFLPPSEVAQGVGTSLTQITNYYYSQEVNSADWSKIKED